MSVNLCSVYSPKQIITMQQKKVVSMAYTIVFAYKPTLQFIDNCSCVTLLRSQ